MTFRRSAILTAGLLLAAAGFIRAQSTPPPSDAPAPEVRKITIKAHKYAFEPASIKVRVGERVELTLVGLDKKHGFICKDLGIEKTVCEPGTDGHVAFTAQKAGTYPFKCAVWCGFGHGRMVGEIVVTEK